MNFLIARGLLIPFLGTSLGAALVFFMKRELNLKLQNMLSGFAAGVMVAASVWSLLIPYRSRLSGTHKALMRKRCLQLW